MTTSTEKPAEERGTWSGKLDFTMSALSFAVGMGNLWRFPYLCYRGGGGAFLIPYLLAMFAAGYPLMLMEYGLGQYGRQGVVGVWRACPLFQGVGWGMFAVSAFTGIYYNMIIAWCFFYMFASFASDVPWRDCSHDWNSPACASSSVRAAMFNCTAYNGTYLRHNDTCLPSSPDDVISNVTSSPAAAVDAVMSPTDDFFHNYMLDISGGFHEMGGVRWQLTLCLLLCWVIVFFSLAKGITVSGKVTYVTALFPYVVLLILLVRGVTLNGSLQGIMYYITPRWQQLASAQVWADAAIQVFFSLSLCWGGLITLSSYNKFDNDCVRDTLVVATGDMLTSIFGGFVTFSIIGFMATELRLPIDKVATHGPGLVFIVYPEGIAQLPVSPLWSILFMLMLINVGIGSQMGIVSTLHATIIDKFQSHFTAARRRILLLLVICSIQFILALSLCTNGGIYMLVLLDTYAPTYAVLVIALFECVAVAWVYGARQFSENIEEMLGRQICIWWMIAWKFVSPAFIIFILAFILADTKRTSYMDYTFPLVWDLLGWTIPLIISLCIPLVAVIKIVNNRRSKHTKTVTELCQPTSDWAQYARQMTENQLTTAKMTGEEDQLNDTTEHDSNILMTTRC